MSADSISMSISELTSLYKEETLVIRPEFQRLYRWSIEQKSRLVESVMLGIPLPSIFVSTDEEGRWELVDGLQRVSTLLELQGLLEGSDGQVKPALVLSETRYLKHLRGKSWDGPEESQLSKAQKLDLRLARLDIRVIKRSSDPKAKFDLFQRLNSFGSALTPQEIRSALIAGVNGDALAWLHKLSTLKSFVDTVALGDRLLEEQYDLELILRFLMLHNFDFQGKRGGLGDFPSKLDTWALDFAEKFPENKDELEVVFLTTFSSLAVQGTDVIFRKWDASSNSFRGGFSNTSFEVIALGAAFHLAQNQPYRADVLEAAKELWNSMGTTIGSVTGLATGDRFAKTLRLGRELMAP
ncbi:hypothetical protein ASF06_05395 [Agreia sp. Leaf244]|nr:hypothetical protein ASF06_05395 [Agreia sp. Leaf244]